MRMIDADRLLDALNSVILDYTSEGKYPDGFGIDDAINLVEDAPTLTPPNEWVSVETPPTEQGWYHVAILDLKTGKYNVEQDLYSIELAKKHGFEPGFCKEIRWEERAYRLLVQIPIPA